MGKLNTICLVHYKLYLARPSFNEELLCSDDEEYTVESVSVTTLLVTRGGGEGRPLPLTIYLVSAVKKNNIPLGWGRVGKGVA